jgi:hypothetical protein
MEHRVQRLRFSNAGSFGNTSNTININGGRLSNTGTLTIASTHLIQLGNTAGTTINTVTGNLTLMALSQIFRHQHLVHW